MKEKSGLHYVKCLLDDFTALGNAFDRENINHVLMRRGEEFKSDRKKLMTMVRVALTGTNKGFVGRFKSNGI